MEEISLWWLLAVAIAGAVAGGGSIFVIVSRANKSLELKDATEERLASLVPQSALDTISALADRAFDVVEVYGAQVQQSILDAAEFIGDVTDGEPNG